MGHNVSAIAGVKSSNFYEQGNAINEIWVDDVELISRLPFGDSDLGQAGWPKGGWPKIPWHQFIIPLKRDLSQNITMLARDVNQESCYCAPSYMDTGYLSMYKGWGSYLGEFHATVLIALAIWLIADVFFSLRWGRFCQELEELVQKPPKTVKQTIDIPTEIRSDQQGRNVVMRWCIRKFLVLGMSVGLLFFAYPATAIFVPWGTQKLPVTFFARSIITYLVAFAVSSLAGCMMNVVLFYQSLRARHLFEPAEIVTIPVTPIPGTNTWTVACFARETPDV